MKSISLVALILLISISSVYSQNKKSKIPKDVLKSPELLAKYLTAGISSDKQKVDSIYSWITHNIAYDYKALESTKPSGFQSPKETLKRKKAICSGYVFLMQDMLKAINIQNEYIEGYSRPAELDTMYTVYESDHAWIAFLVNNEWKLADPTWDSGYLGRIPKKKKTFPKRWLKEKTFKWEKRTNYRKKRIEKKKKQFDIKQEKRDPYTNKFGFVREPAKDWYCVDPDSFLLTHLPTLPQWQLKKKPILVDQFCDKREKLKDNFKNPKGNEIDFEKLNEEYFEKNLLDKWIYTAEEGHKYNEYNFGVKAIQYHNFIAGLTVKEFQKDLEYLPIDHPMPINEVLMGYCDTITIYSKGAINVEKGAYKSESKNVALKYKTSGVKNKEQLKEFEKLEKGIDKHTSNIGLASERISKELEFCTKKEEELVNKYNNILAEQSIIETDKIALAPLFKSIDSMELKMKNFYKKWEDQVDTTCLGSLYNKYNDITYWQQINELYLSLNSQQTEKETKELDSLILNGLVKMNKTFNDSLIKELAGKESFTDLKNFEQIIKKYKTILKSKEGDKSISNASKIEFFINSKFYQLVVLHHKHLQQLENYCDFINPELQLFMKELSVISSGIENSTDSKEKRNTFLVDQMKKGNERTLKLYELTTKNAKKWKVAFKK